MSVLLLVCRVVLFVVDDCGFVRYSVSCVIFFGLMKCFRSEVVLCVVMVCFSLDVGSFCVRVICFMVCVMFFE